MLPDIGLKPRHNRLTSTDPGCYLSLGKSGFSSGLQDFVEELEFLSERGVWNTQKEMNCRLFRRVTREPVI
jgi:hypothetical protein